MLHFSFNSNVNLWVKIHLIYEEMFSWILIMLQSHLLFCGMQNSCFSIFKCDHVQLFKNLNANTLQSKLFFSKKEFSIEPHVWSIKMIKLGNYFFLNMVTAQTLWEETVAEEKKTETEVFEKIWSYFSLTSALCPWNYLYIWNFIPSSSILWKVRKTRGYKGGHA